MADSNGCQVRGHVGENTEYLSLPWYWVGEIQCTPEQMN